MYSLYFSDSLWKESRYSISFPFTTFFFFFFFSFSHSVPFYSFLHSHLFCFFCTPHLSCWPNFSSSLSHALSNGFIKGTTTTDRSSQTSIWSRKSGRSPASINVTVHSWWAPASILTSQRELQMDVTLLFLFSQPSLFACVPPQPRHPPKYSGYLSSPPSRRSIFNL